MSQGFQVQHANSVHHSGATQKAHAAKAQDPKNTTVPMVKNAKTEPTPEEKRFKADLASGKLKHEEGRTLLIFHYDNYVYTPGTNKKTGKRETLGDISKRYNLPDGYLRHYVTEGGGAFNTYKAPDKVVIDGETLRKSILGE